MTFCCNVIHESGVEPPAAMSTRPVGSLEPWSWRPCGAVTHDNWVWNHEGQQMNTSVRRSPLAAALVVAGLLALTGCGDDSPPPTVSVACPPGEVEITVINRSDGVERYTVSVNFTRAGDTERESYSSDGVEAGGTATITDSRPDEEQRCSIEKAEVFR